jgi:hypothetical protein
MEREGKNHDRLQAYLEREIRRRQPVPDWKRTLQEFITLTHYTLINKKRVHADF